MKSLIMSLKQILSESKEELSTVGLQLASLGMFMDSLNYVYKNKNGTTFTYKGEDKRFPKELAWKDAVILHNTGFFLIGDKGFYQVPQMHVHYVKSYTFDLKEAVNSSPLVKIYLQWNKKKKHWQTSTNRIKFNEEYFNG